MIVIYQDYSIDGENWLFPDAEPREHSPQHLLRSNLPANLPDMVQGLAYVLRYEFRGDSSEEGFAAACEGFQGFLEGLVVAEVGDEGGGGVGCVGCGGGGEGCGDFGQAEAVAGADGEGAGGGEAIPAGEVLG